jgi:cytochrome d ubiquinol oxidase subunit I
MKMAAAEALWESADPASFSLFTIGDMTNRKDVVSIRIPGVLSLLAFNQLTGKVQGINELQAQYAAQYGPGNYVPPAVVTYWSFRIMVGAGFVMIALALYALLMVMGDMIERRPRALKLLALALILPYLANSSGWLLTEVGRFPWVVFQQVKLEQGVSPNVTTGMLLVSLIGYILVYGALIVATVYLMVKYGKAGLEKFPAEGIPPAEEASPLLAGAQD